MILALQAPLNISDVIKRACRLMAPDYKPLFLAVTPKQGLQPQQCFPNVDRKVLHEGGKSAFGWAVYLMPRLWIEFQAHAIWVSPEGKLVDPTPRSDGERVVLFLPDSWQYSGQALDTRFIPLSSDIRLKQFFEIQRKINLLGVENRPAYATPGMKWPVDVGQIQSLERQKITLMSDFDYTVERNDACPCMSRRKFKQCCGR